MRNEMVRIVRRAVVAAVSLMAWKANGTIITGVEPIALDLPRLNAEVEFSVGGAASGQPIVADFAGAKAFNLQGYLATGTAGLQISSSQSGLYGTLLNPGVTMATSGGQAVSMVDRSASYQVSTPVYVSFGHDTPGQADRIWQMEDQLSTDGTLGDLSTIYQHKSGEVRLAVGNLSNALANAHPTLEPLNVFGAPAVAGRVAVIDPRPVDTLADSARTYLYHPGTAFHPGNAEDPGVPQTPQMLKLSFGDLSGFSLTTPAGATGATMGRVPFVGQAPGTSDADSPKVKLAFGGRAAAGSFLLDTGSPVSIISRAMAASLGVSVDATDPANPKLKGVAAENQFRATVAMDGGPVSAPGFYLDSLLLRSSGGSAANDGDPHHLQFNRAPVVVSDVTYANPSTGARLTLDGVLGMNYFLASGLGGANGMSLIDKTPGAFDWLVYDPTAGTFGVRSRRAGDANRDGAVDVADFAILMANLSNSENLTWDQGDFNGDGMVDFRDFQMQETNFGVDVNEPVGAVALHSLADPFAGGVAVGAQPVPEPGVGAVLGVMMIGLGRRGRKSREEVVE